MSARLAEFDKRIASLTKVRGSDYGPPKVDFDRANRIKAVVAECKDPLARHVLDMLAVKMSRLIQSPDHLDSWLDIAGYARCGVEVTDEVWAAEAVEAAARGSYDVDHYDLMTMPEPDNPRTWDRAIIGPMSDRKVEVRDPTFAELNAVMPAERRRNIYPEHPAHTMLREAASDTRPCDTERQDYSEGLSPRSQNTST